jgi:ureidoglycolate lyase
MTSTEHGTVHVVTARPLTAESFSPYGEVLRPTADGSPPLPGEDRLDLSRGTPRFYLMELADKPARFVSITRHRQVTQCLAAVGGSQWLLAVAPPGDPDDPTRRPSLDEVAGFLVPGDVAVLLHRGTWHAGPFFDAPTMSFFNLELADTNVVDHQSHSLAGEGVSHCTLIPA